MTIIANKLSPACRDALKLAAIEQLLIGLFTGLLLDNGYLFTAFLYSIASFWAGFAIIAVRRALTPSKLDILLIKWGTFLLFGISTALAYAVIWPWRGLID